MARKDQRPNNDLRQRRSEVERISELAGQAKIDVHEAASDPHSQYATDTDLSNHEAAADPHPTYMTEAEVQALLSAGRAWMPLTSVVSGAVKLVLDDDNSLIPTRVPTT